MEFGLLFLASYLLGSISSAVIVSKLFGFPDPRTHGSKNPGATNVLRLGGKFAAFITLLADALKGFIPVLVGICFQFNIIVLTALLAAAFIGHILPLFFSLKGGKGVATFIGGLILLNWQTALCWIIIWGIIAKIFRYSSLAALTASSLAPIYFYYFTGSKPAALLVYIIILLMIYRHKNNIQHIITGKENKLGSKK